VQTIVLKALAKERERRYQSVGELARDVGHYLAEEPIEARRDSVWYVLKLSIKRNQRRFVTVAAALVVIISAFAVWMWQKDVAAREIQQRETARRQEAEDHVLYGNHLVELGQWEQAEQQYRTALGIVPDNIDAMTNLARLKEDQYRQTPFPEADQSWLQQALQYCDRALGQNPGDIELLNVKTVVLFLLGRLDEAEQACDRSLQKTPDFYGPHLNRAIILAMRGELGEAHRSAVTATDLAERGQYTGTRWTSGTWRTLGTIELQQRRPEALRSLERALECERTNEWTYLIRARLRLELEGNIDYAAALDDAKIADANTVTSDGRIKRILALAHLRNGNFSEAIGHAQQAIDNGDLEAVNQLIMSIAEAKRGNLDEARRWYDKAGQSSWSADLPGKDFSAHAAREVLWFESTAALERLRDEAELLLAPASP
jgi:tetratricopeptide (TPR) repeat protein